MTSHIPLSTLVEATADELSSLRHQAEGVQAILTLTGEISDEAVIALQRLDYLTQSLEALSEFWAKTHQHIPQDLTLRCAPALNDIKLDELAKRLKGEAINVSDEGVLEEF